MPQRIIGVDIGSYSVKAAVVERSLRSFSFVEFYDKPIQYSDVLSKEESIAIAIQGLIDDHNLEWDIACIGFPAQKITSRLLTFPFSGYKKIDQAIHFEIESHIPFGIDQIVIDHAVISRSKNESRVMAVYVQKTELAKLLSMVESVNLDPRYVCAEGIELVNLVNLGMVPPEGAFAVIDVGHEKSTVTICHGRNLGYMRAISVAGRAITSSIAKKLGVSYEEAERLKIEMGQLPPSEEVLDDLTKSVTDAIKETMDEFLLHLRQTIFTFKETEGVPVEGIYLCGGTSRLPGIDRYLSDALKLNVTYLNSQDFHFSQVERAEAHRHVIPQALALSLKGVAGGGADINLRQGEFQFKGDVEQFGGNLRKVSLVVGAIIFLALANFSIKYYSVKRQVDKINSDVVALMSQSLPDVPRRAISTPKSAVALIKSRQAEAEEKISQMNAITGASPLDTLKEVSQSFPSREDLKIEVTDITIGDGKVIFSGIVDDFKAVDTVKLAFEKSSKFVNVNTANVSKGVKGEVKFKLNMELASAQKEKIEEVPAPVKNVKGKKTEKGEKGGN